MFVLTAGSNVHSLSRECYRFRRGHRAWRAYKVYHSYLGDLTISVMMYSGGKDKQSLKEGGARPEGSSEVRSSHSSDEARESVWSEGDDKSASNLKPATEGTRGQLL